MRVGEVEPCWARPIEHRECDLEEGAAGVRHDLGLPDRPRFLQPHRVDEAVAELPEAPPDDLPPAEWDQEDSAHRKERLGMEGEDALGRSRVDRDARPPEPAIEE